MQKLSGFSNYISSCLNEGYDLSFRSCLTALDLHGYTTAAITKWKWSCVAFVHVAWVHTQCHICVLLQLHRQSLNFFILLFLPLQLIFLWT